jgi:hypothetical protein
MIIIAITNAIIGNTVGSGVVPPPVVDYIVAENTDNLITEDSSEPMIIE